MLAPQCCDIYVASIEGKDEKLNGEFPRLFQATYDNRFEWGLMHSSSGKFGVQNILCMLILISVEINLYRKRNKNIWYIEDEELNG